MKAKFIIVGEKVHEVGYRAVLLSKAFSLGIDRFSVFNSLINDKQAVIVLVDAEKEEIEALKDFMKSYKPEKAIVEEIKEEKYKGKIPNIERTMQAFQTEQWSKGIPILLEIRENTRLIPEIAENTRLIPEIAENTRLIPEVVKKQDELISIVKNGFATLKQEHIQTRELSKEIRKSWRRFRFGIMDLFALEMERVAK